MATIAIAEDEEDLREAVAEYLTDRGYRVLQAGNGAAFRALVAAEAVELAILDIQMPGEDGLSLARWLRGQSRAGIIFATAADAPVDLFVNKKRIARGEVVVVEDRFGIRITELLGGAAVGNSA